MLVRCPFRLRLLTLTIAVLLSKNAFPASPWTEPASAFAQRIADTVGAGSAITLTARNLSSLSTSDFTDARAQIMAQLHARGLKVVEEARATAGVSITLSENAEAYLWIAEIALPQANPGIIMLRVPRPQPVPARAGPSMRLAKKLLWSQPDGEPILDATTLELVGGPSRLVLTPSRVALYVFYGKQWQEELSLALPVRSGAPPRDPRGRLVLRPDRLFDVYLPGRKCSSTNYPKLTINCVESDDPWPLDVRESLQAFYAPARNFFNGTLAGPAAGGKTVSPFFSAAKVDENGTELWLLAGVDGRIRLFNDANETTVGFRNWGSDIASVKTGCGAGSQVLATRPGESAENDAVQAYEVFVIAREAIAVSDPVEFPGPVTALWPAENGATAVARNVKTNRYEAYSLSLDCGQ